MFRDGSPGAAGARLHAVSCCVSLQAEYEVTPDEKRRECGQELVNKYFNPKVTAAFSASPLRNITPAVQPRITALCTVEISIYFNIPCPDLCCVSSAVSLSFMFVRV